MPVPYFVNEWRSYPYICQSFGGPIHIYPDKIYDYLNIQQNVIVNINEEGLLSVEPCSKIILMQNSNLNFKLNSTLIVKGKLVNNGGYITHDPFANIKIIYNNKYPWSWCSASPDNGQINIFPDGSTITFEDSASTELDSGSVMIIEGSNSKLIMNPNSKLFFGKNSKLILKDGAHIVANNATFTSLDSIPNIWNGIYLEDQAYDTLTNCIIENAANGITT